MRGDTTVIVERRRPIVLRHHFAVHRREDDQTLLLPLLEDNGRPGTEGLRIDQAVRRALQGRSVHWQPRGRGPRLPCRAPLRTEMVDELGRRDMLPAIVFIFSRAACDDAVRQVMRDGVRLTDASERSAIRQVAERRVESLEDDDLRVLGYDEWLEGLERGLAAHHAGLVPVFRETVEECFAAGLLKVVFATETLSLGINMPARSVVIERFTKYGGAGRATLTSGEYLQLTGRAGRRGLDEEGHAVVEWSTEITFAEAARVASDPPPDLRSSFRPTYNLAVNLVSRFDRADRRRGAAPVLRPVAGPAAGPPDAATGPPTRGARGDGLRQRLGADTVGPSAVPHLPRGGPPDRGGLGSDALAGAEPSVVAGVLSAVVFEPRRARPPARPSGPAREKRRRPAPGPAGRQAQLRAGLALCGGRRDGGEGPRRGGGPPRAPGSASRTRAGRRRGAWVRGASLATVLQVAVPTGASWRPATSCGS